MSGAPAARSALEHVGVVEQPIEQRGDRSGVAEQLAPVFDWTIAREQRRRALVATHDELEEKLGEKVVVDNLYIAFRGDAASSEVAIKQALGELRSDERPNHADALRLAEGCARGRLSKFQPCLPPRLEAELLAEALTDDASARAALDGLTVQGRHEAP